jgi:hypothetical protein
MLPDSLDDPILDSSIFHVGRPCEVRDFAKELQKACQSGQRNGAPDPPKDRDRQVWEECRNDGPAQLQRTSVRAVPK